jgi:hypothetical protein
MIRGSSNLGVAQSAMIRTAIVQTHRGVQSFVASGKKSLSLFIRVIRVGSEIFSAGRAVLSSAIPAALLRCVRAE